MELDTRTLILVLFFCNALMGLTLMWVLRDGKEEGANLWVASLFMKSFGTGVLLLPHTALTPVVLYAGAVTVTGAYTVNYLALCLFLRTRRNAWLAFGPLVVAAIAFALKSQILGYADVVVDLVRCVLIATVIALLVRQKTWRQDHAQSLVIIGFATGLVVFGGRVLANVLDPASFASFDRSNLGRSVTFLLSFTVSILTSFGLVLMYRKRATLALMASEAQLSHFKALVDSSDDAIIGKNLEGIVGSWNSGAQRMFGYTAQEAIGQPMGFLMPAERAVEERDILSKIRMGARINHFETVRRCKDGQLIDVSVTISPIKNRDGEIVGASKIARDITERKQLEAELNAYRNDLEDIVRVRTLELTAAREAAEAANRAKSVFLANMSHELRTPMNGLMGMTELAVRRATDAKLQGYLARVQQASRHLLAIINDILDISRIEANRLPLEARDFKLADLLEEVTGLLDAEASNKGLLLGTQLEPRLGAMTLRGDPVRLRQVLLNLTGNAIKFTHAGSVTVHAGSTAGEASRLEVRFEVRDTGIGISAEDQKRLFVPFQQVDDSMTRSFGGTGLGLAISERLVVAMGGRIGVDSQPGAGSTFWFTVPLDRGKVPVDAQPQADWSAEVALRARCAGARILLAEDDPGNQEVARSLLEEAGLHVDVVHDGAQAVEAVKQGAYALVLMDLQMPHLNGLEATRAIRTLPGHEKLPIVALTANAFDDDRDRCLEAGMSDFLIKPVSPGLLYATVLRNLDQPA